MITTLTPSEMTQLRTFVPRGLVDIIPYSDFSKSLKSHLHSSKSPVITIGKNTASYTRKTWKAFERDQCKCQLCGVQAQCVIIIKKQVHNRSTTNAIAALSFVDGKLRLFNIDHILPVSLGGSGEISNLQTTCHVCNTSKRHYPSQAEIERITDNISEHKLFYLDEDLIVNTLQLISEKRTATCNKKTLMEEIYKQISIISHHKKTFSALVNDCSIINNWNSHGVSALLKTNNYGIQQFAFQRLEQKAWNFDIILNWFDVRLASLTRLFPIH